MTEKEFINRFTTNLLHFKNAKKMTNKHIADECLMSRTEVSLIFSGKRMPRASTICYISEVLGIDPVELFKPIPVERRMMNK